MTSDQYQGPPLGIREAPPVDVTLFAVNPDESRTFVADIGDLECLTDEKAESALDATSFT